MQKITNYHTHSIYCDGVNTLQEMAKAAFDAGITTLGFSAHSAYPFASHWHMDPRNFEKYFKDIDVLKSEYDGKMEILAGLEAEYLPPISYCKKDAVQDFNVDFMIGSVHYITVNDGSKDICLTIDGPAQEVFHGIQKYFAGNGKKAVQAYFSAQRDMIKIGDFDIIGHLDLIRKRNGELKFFDENDSWYRKELKETAKVVGKSGKVVEINTGGMERVNLPSPYPTVDFLKLLKPYDVPITINSDCHSIDSIVSHYDAAIKAAIEAGYTSTHHLSGGEWRTSNII